MKSLANFMRISVQVVAAFLVVAAVDLVFGLCFFLACK